MNTFGKSLKVTLFGESHTPTLGVRIEGVPAGIRISAEDLSEDIRRRAPGKPYTTARREDDIPLIEGTDASGRTDGGAVTISFRNSDTRSGDYESLTFHRPGHADFVSSVRYGRAFPGGGIFSGRMTLPIVAAGTVARMMLPGVTVSASIKEIGGVPFADREAVESALEKAAREGDSLGGIVECRVDGIPAGIGEPFFDSVESSLSHFIFSIPGVRGVEFGDGFAAARSRGSEHNDTYLDAEGTTATNHCGGVNGGLSNGNQIVFRVAFKPTSSISATQISYDYAAGRVSRVSIRGRHDVCFCLRTPVIVESAAAIVLADLVTRSECACRG